MILVNKLLSLIGNKGNAKQSKEMPFHSPIKVTESKKNDVVTSIDSLHCWEIKMYVFFGADNLMVSVDIYHGHALIT